MKKATFAAGCFWHVEEIFSKTSGVKSTQVGYTGGDLENPTYEQVCTDRTGHAEAIQVEYEPEEISGYTSQLKATLETGMEPPGHIVYCYVADESINASTRLKIRLIGSTILDLMTVSLNKIILPWETCTRTDHDGYYGTWLEFPLEQGVLCKGRNEVAVTLRTRPDNLALPVLLESVDRIVEYSSPKSN